MGSYTCKTGSILSSITLDCGWIARVQVWGKVQAHSSILYSKIDQHTMALFYVLHDAAEGY